MKLDMKSTILLAIVIIGTVEVSAQRTLKSSGVSDLLVVFENASSDMTFLSETDAEVHNFVAPLTASRLTSEEFLRVNIMPADTSIAILDFDAWIEHQTQFDRRGRWERLRSTMTSRLGEVVVFKVGVIQIQYFAVGLYKGRMIGVRTFGVST